MAASEPRRSHCGRTSVINPLVLSEVDEKYRFGKQSVNGHLVTHNEVTADESFSLQFDMDHAA